MTYDVDYFIAKFEAIPEELWCVDAYTKGRKHCARGFCGETSDKETREGIALEKLIRWPAMINDGGRSNYKQPTPKQRILAALYDVKNGVPA